MTSNDFMNRISINAIKEIMKNDEYSDSLKLELVRFECGLHDKLMEEEK